MQSFKILYLIKHLPCSFWDAFLPTMAIQSEYLNYHRLSTPTSLAIFLIKKAFPLTELQDSLYVLDEIIT